MNKTNKKSKVDKCPSTFTQENKVKDVSKKCILNEKIQEKNELKNGLFNGIVHDSSNIKKGSRKSKKNKHLSNDINGESVANKESESRSRPNENCIGKTASQNEILEDQSSEHVEKNSTTKSDNNVNNVDKQVKGSKKKKCKLGKLDSNDNISTNASCDKELFLEQPINEKATDNHVEENSELNQLLKDKPAASCSSNMSIINANFTNINCGSNDTGTDSTVLEVTGSLRNVQLEDSSEKTEICVVSDKPKPKINFIQYESELQMPMIMKIIQKDLSEPYSIYTYRYFIHNWPKLCFLVSISFLYLHLPTAYLAYFIIFFQAMCGEECVGAIVCKLDLHRKVIKRGYIAMLAVDQNYRKLRIGSNLVQMAINEMIMGDADEVVLETEVTNKPALQLYEKLGFVRDKRLFRYYLNGVDALRLKLWLR